MEECNISYHIWKSAIYRTIYGRVQYIIPYMEECSILIYTVKTIPLLKFVTVTQ